MGAADDIRAGKLAKYAALQEAGVNTHTVEIMLFISASGQKNYAGKSGEQRYNRLTISPTPEVVFRRQVISTPNGFENVSDVSLKGAFPQSLSGDEVVLTNGEQTASSPTSKSYAGPRAFRLDIEAAEYFLIDGEKYKYRAGGFMAVDKYEGEWSLKLIRADKQ
jgi:hypothetical protein